MNKKSIVKVVLEGKYYESVGRRKRAIARIRLHKGKGQFLVNYKKIDQPSDILTSPLKLVGLLDKYDVNATVHGGGVKSQLEAIRHGLSRALVKLDESLKPTLRKAGFITRDPREKERKKPGLKRARKAPQWQKR